MKKVIVILCLLCMAQTVFAAAHDRNYFEYDLTPSGEYSEEADKTDVKTTTTTVEQQTESVKETQNTQTEETKQQKPRRRFWGSGGSSQSSTYWDFGRPNYGYSGSIQ